jgi:hypothetical protein
MAAGQGRNGRDEGRQTGDAGTGPCSDCLFRFIDCEQVLARHARRAPSRRRRHIDTRRPPGDGPRPRLRPRMRDCRHCAHCGRVRSGRGTRWVCANTPQAPGRIVPVEPEGVCPHFARRRGPPAWCRLPGPLDPHARCIALSKGLFTVVDAWNFERLNRHRWSALVAGHTCYAARREGRRGRTILMHREIMDPPPGMVVDHIDGNGLTNRECNLRVCTQAQNGYNRIACLRGHSSRFKGVFWCRAARKWCAMIGFHHRSIYLGLFEDEVEAAHVRDYKAVELHGVYAYLNFPEEWPAERRRAVYERHQAGAGSDKR